MTIDQHKQHATAIASMKDSVAAMPQTRRTEQLASLLKKVEVDLRRLCFKEFQTTAPYDAS